MIGLWSGFGDGEKIKKEKQNKNSLSNETDCKQHATTITRIKYTVMERAKDRYTIAYIKSLGGHASYME